MGDLVSPVATFREARDGLKYGISCKIREIWQPRVILIGIVCVEICYHYEDVVQRETVFFIIVMYVLIRVNEVMFPAESV